MSLLPRHSDPDDWDQGRLLGLEEAASLTAVYAKGALLEVEWYAKRLAEIEAECNVPPAWLKAIIQDHEQTLRVKREVAVALCQAVYREAKLLGGIDGRKEASE